ncbi:hypothetical protein MKW94_013990 [Papaver nudicaule]|uniref:Son of sevenless n=1 Tax=Papaver nudicaule TaxID=74823 RepID=A0AA42AXY0_PAPNU|nr:hypothetical protein [Papaver nudicaule]
MDESSEISPKIELKCMVKTEDEEEEDELVELQGNNNGIIQTPELERRRRRSFCSDDEFHPMNALEILQETIRILRYNSSGFMIIAALLICPVCAVVLSNVFVDQSVMKRFTIRLLLVARSSGIPLRPLVKVSCQRLAEMTLSAIFCFPMYITFSLLSKAAIVYCVDCTYLRRKFRLINFFLIVLKIWKRLVITYMWVCMVVAAVLALFLLLLVAVSNVFTIFGCPSHLIIYPALGVGMVFSVMFANAIIICNLAIVISVLEVVSGPEALLRSGVLIRGQTQVGLLIFLGSTIGMAFVEGLFEHRVKTLSYGDGSSRIWEGPLLVIMYSFVVLIDSMMSAVFYFTCRSSNIETSEEDGHTLVEAAAFSPVSLGVQ